MKKLLTAVCVASALAFAAQAEDTTPAPKTEKHEQKLKKLTDEQAALMKEMTAKYDANKDGKLDKEERAKISPEDQAKLDKAGLGHHKKDAAASTTKDQGSK